MTTIGVDAPQDRLAEAVHLLRQAALEVWNRVDNSGSRAALHALGVGIYLAEATAAALLPDGYQIPDTSVESSTPRQLLEQAEQLTRNLPLDSPELTGVSGLVVDLCDLIREARDAGF